MTRFESLAAFGRLAAGLSPIARTSGPSTADEVTDDLLARVLAPGAVGASVHSEQTGGTAGTTDRRQLRLEWSNAPDDINVPASVFLKATPASAVNRGMLAALRMNEGEVRFYQQLRAAMEDDIAPRCFHAEEYGGGRMLLILEDMSLRGCTMPTLADPLTREQLEARVDVLAAVHAPFWQSPRFAADLDWVRPQTERPGFRLMQQMFQYSRKYLVKHRERFGIDDRTVAFVHELRTRNMGIQHLWEQVPQTVVHGDTHSGNSFDHPDGRAGYLDWQVIHRQHGLRDVTYLLITSAPIDLRRARERDMIVRYRDAMGERGVDLPPVDDLWELYRLYATEAFDAAISTLPYEGGMQDVENGVASMRRAVQAVEDLELERLLVDASEGRWTLPARLRT